MIGFRSKILIDNKFPKSLFFFKNLDKIEYLKLKLKNVLLFLNLEIFFNSFILVTGIFSQNNSFQSYYCI